MKLNGALVLYIGVKAVLTNDTFVLPFEGLCKQYCSGAAVMKPTLARCPWSYVTQLDVLRQSSRALNINRYIEMCIKFSPQIISKEIEVFICCYHYGRCESLATFFIIL